MTRLVALVALALVASGCTDPIGPAAPTPAPATITENFTGTLAVLGTNSHPFTVSQIGGVKVTLKSVDQNAAVKLAIGLVSGAVCVPSTIVTTPPGDVPQLSGTATLTGSFCVLVADPGSLTDSVQYAIIVVHS